MCGRFALEIPADELAALYQLAETPELCPRYNIAPSQLVAVVREQEDAQRHLVRITWGLIPSWAKDPKIGYQMINARSETVDEKPSFKQAFRTRRCLIPASGFYEWQKLGREKIPHYFSLLEGEIMSLAGLWECWQAPQGEKIETCTILTTSANSLVQNIHERMPVILPAEHHARWLDRQWNDTRSLKEILRPYPAEEMTGYTVSKEVNSPGHDAPGCIVRHTNRA